MTPAPVACLCVCVIHPFDPIVRWSAVDVGVCVTSRCWNPDTHLRSVPVLTCLSLWYQQFEPLAPQCPRTLSVCALLRRLGGAGTQGQRVLCSPEVVLTSSCKQKAFPAFFVRSLERLLLVSAAFSGLWRVTVQGFEIGAYY